MNPVPKLPAALAGLRLRVEIWLAGQGMLALLGWLLLLAAAPVWLALPAAERAEAEQAARLARASQLPPNPSPSRSADSDAARLAALYQVLDQADARNQGLAQLFQIAAQEGWDIAGADYTVSRQRKAGLERMQILLPLEGNYPDIRALAEALLRGKPNLSLDDISFKRESAEADDLKATLKLSLWSRLSQAEPATAPSGQQEQGR